jgi:aminoglycoside phosphotransferase family enzyme/predicted kinase
MRQVLLAPVTYSRSPFHVQRTAKAPPEVVETHISWVALTGELAYKVKKPVRYDFLDYGTLERRREACDVELKLNQRWAPEIYLGVSRLVRVADGVFLDIEGEVTDYAVRMRQFNREDELDALIARGAVEPDAIIVLARSVADQHRLAPVAPPAVNAALNVRHFAEQNLSWLRGVAGGVEAEYLAEWTSRQWSELEGLLNRRQALGRVRECHGDLHCGNVVRVASRLTPFDGIDFDPRLRWIDVASDIAFLVMDLECRGRPDLAMSCLSAWLERSGDYDASACVRFFLVHRALVRAKIARLRCDQVGEPSASAAREEAAKYIVEAKACKERTARALVLMHGFSGSGKSILAAKLVPELAAIMVRADVFRPRAAVSEVGDTSASPLNAGLYSPANTIRTYQALAAAASGLLSAGCTVIVDATFLDKHWRDQFRCLGSRAGAPVLNVDCQAPVTTLRDRIAGRSHDPSEATLAVLEDQLSRGSELDDAEKRMSILVRTHGATSAREVAARLRTIWGTL